MPQFSALGLVAQGEQPPLHLSLVVRNAVEKAIQAQVLWKRHTALQSAQNEPIDLDIVVLQAQADRRGAFRRGLPVATRRLLDALKSFARLLLHRRDTLKTGTQPHVRNSQVGDIVLPVLLVHRPRLRVAACGGQTPEATGQRHQRVLLGAFPEALQARRSHCADAVDKPHRVGDARRLDAGQSVLEIPWPIESAAQQNTKLWILAKGVHDGR
mmetsp:Transcript_98352/g.283825  ORF Transcript_98352/g.283825 Transcript_98352/m.283825 type:complete len:213 (+) Transcript_98352:988-1626(+)